MSQVYKTSRHLRFREADPAQIMFFGNIFGICHDAYEDFLTSLGIPWESYFKSSQFAVPVRKSDCEFFRPIYAGQDYEIEIKLTQLGESSFTVNFCFLSPLAEKLAEASSSHVFVNPQTLKKTPIPPNLREKFKLFLQARPLESK